MALGDPGKSSIAVDLDELVAGAFELRAQSRELFSPLGRQTASRYGTATTSLGWRALPAGDRVRGNRTWAATAAGFPAARHGAARSIVATSRAKSPT